MEREYLHVIRAPSTSACLRTCMNAQLLSCVWLCNPMDCSPPGSSVHEILQARILEWLVISSSRESFQPRDQTFISCIAGGCFTIFSSVQSLSRVWLFATPWTATRQDSLPITNSRGLLKLMSIESVMPSNHLILCRPLHPCLQSFPTSGSFQMSQFFSSGGQSIGVATSTSVFPINTQDWSP